MTSSALTSEVTSGRVEHLAHRHPVVIALARFGWVAKGIVYGLIGVLAVPIAIEGLRADRARNGDEEASLLGAVTEIAETSLGAIALSVVAAGLALYVLWRLVSIVLPAENTAAVDGHVGGTVAGGSDRRLRGGRRDLLRGQGRSGELTRRATVRFWPSDARRSRRVVA